MAGECGEKLGTWRGRVYVIDYVGATEYGRRAKLTPLDGGRSVWAKPDEVRPVRCMADVIDALPPPQTPADARTGIAAAARRAVDAILGDLRAAVSALPVAHETGGLDQVAHQVAELRAIARLTAEGLGDELRRLEAGLADTDAMLRREILGLGGAAG